MKIKRILPLTAAALGLIGSFFLPNAVAGVMDARRLDKLVIIDAQSIQFGAYPELSLPKRIALAASPNTEMLALATGQTMEIDIAEIAALKELAKFFSSDVYEFETDDCVFEDGSVSLVIDTEDPSANMIAWEFRIRDRQTNKVTVTIDDETGAILKLIYQKGDDAPGQENSDDGNLPVPTDGEMYAAALQLSQMMAGYYGIRVELGEYQYSGSFSYYMATMYSGGLVIPMYGVVRATSFTMNERL